MRGFDGLSSFVQNTLAESFSVILSCFADGAAISKNRCGGRRRFRLLAKRLESGALSGRKPSGSVSLTAQLMLLRVLACRV